MADVTLTLKSNNSDYISKMKQAQTETQKVYDTAEKGGKREKGILEEIDATLTRLEKSKRKAFTYEEIEKYNKKIEEAKQNLQEYENAGVKANTNIKASGDSLMKSVGTWVLGFVSVTTVINLLKDAFKATTQGMNALNIIGAATKQVLNDIVTGVGFQNANVLMAIKSQKELNKLRTEEYKESYDVAKLQKEYQQLYVASLDQTLSKTDRLKTIDAALAVHNKAIDIEVEHTKKTIEATAIALAAAPDNENLYKSYWELTGKLETLDAQRVSETKRLMSTRSGIIQFEIDKQKKISDDARKKEGDANKEYYIGSRDAFFLYIDSLNKKQEEADKAKEDSWKFDLDIGKQNFSAVQKQGKETWDLMIDNNKKLKDAEDKVVKAKEENWTKAGEAVLQYISIIDELAQREVDEAKRKRELLDTQIGETQSALQTEADLQKAGFASNVDAERVKLAALKVARDKALKDEEIALKKAHTLKVAQLVAEQVLALAKVIMSSEIAAAEARVLISNPFTAIPGLALLASVRISEAISIAAITASVIAASLSKFAKGGYTGDGRGYRDETGEEVAGTVHKREFVVRRGPASKFRDVLEAINRDDKKMIFNSFNKLSPELLGGTTVNNVIVENEGPNKRLDQLIKLSKKQSREEVYEFGNQRVIRKGNVTRTIKR